jgi:hypothetical protein
VRLVRYLRPVPRFPRIEIVLEATRIAEAFRAGAQALDDLAADSPHFPTQDLRRLVKALVVATISAAIEAEGDQ